MTDFITITVGGELGLEERALTFSQVAAIEEAFEIENLRHTAALRRGQSTMYIPATVSALRRADGEIRVPRAAHGILRRILGNRIRWVDKRCPGRPHPFSLLVPMREHQVATAEALAKAQQGIANGATGAGKTGAGAATIARLGVWTLWLAPTLDLVRQAADEHLRFLGERAAIFAGGRRDVGPITIATWDTARLHLSELRGMFGLLVVDEAHGCLGDTRIDVLRVMDARSRLALTATLKEEDCRAPLLRWHFGPVVGRYAIADGVEGGVLAAPRWRELRTDFRFDYRGANDWTALQEALFSDVERTALIAGDVAHDALGRLALVLSTRKAPLHDLQAMLVGGGTRAALLTGDMPRRDREDVLTRARAGEIEALLCTQLADEGLDLVNADRLYLTAPSKAPSRLLQRIGRIVRVADGKRQPEVVDVVDHHVGVLEFQARSRRRTFEETWGLVARRAA